MTEEPRGHTAGSLAIPLPLSCHWRQDSGCFSSKTWGNLSRAIEKQVIAHMLSHNQINGCFAMGVKVFPTFVCLRREERVGAVMGPPQGWFPPSPWSSPRRGSHTGGVGASVPHAGTPTMSFPSPSVSQDWREICKRPRGFRKSPEPRLLPQPSRDDSALSGLPLWADEARTVWRRRR